MELRPLIPAIMVVAMALFALPSGAAECGPDRLGTARTLTLPRQYGAYGTMQHEPLPGLKPGEVVLTFDDGPVATTTPAVLTALAVECVQASFFMVGSNILNNPDLARQVLAAGHSVGLHSLTHAHPSAQSPAEQQADLQQTQDAYAKVLGRAAAAYRFPYLEETPTLMAALKAQGMIVMSVDLGIDDWQPDDGTAKFTRLLSERLAAKGGGIILMHDANPQTAVALPTLLRLLKDQGYRVVHLDWSAPSATKTSNR